MVNSLEKTEDVPCIAPFGFEISKDNDGYISLTDLWKAAGSPQNKRPVDWTVTDEAKAFIKVLDRILNAGENGNKKLDKSKSGLKPLLKSKRGKYGGTYAHEQIALEYAQYLDSALAVYVNNLFLNPDAAVNHHVNFWKSKGKSDAWIDERLLGISQRKQFTGVLKTHGVVGDGYRDCTNSIYKNLWGGGADVVRLKKQLPNASNTREHMSAVELSAVRFAETIAQDTIEKQNANGNAECVKICEKASYVVARSIREMKE